MKKTLVAMGAMAALALPMSASAGLYLHAGYGQASYDYSDIDSAGGAVFGAGYRSTTGSASN